MKSSLWSTTSPTSIRLEQFGLALRASPPRLSRADQLIFLCGANQREGVPSVRRQAVKSFLTLLSDANRVVYAEGVLAELAKIGNKGNVLDLEHEISQIADKIIIILESESAFCELGAFSHPALRQKLIVVNDEHFSSSLSFINTGPLAALYEKKAPVLWYPMSEDGVTQLDAIGSVFGGLEKATYAHPWGRSDRLHEDLAALETNKPTLYLVHDLVLFTGPCSYEEMVAMLKRMFGDHRYDRLKKLLGVLRAAGLISSSLVGGSWVYRTHSPRPYLTYDKVDVSALTAAFRGFHLRTNPGRFSFA